MSALEVNAQPHIVALAQAPTDNADMHKKRRDTPLAKLMAAYSEEGLSDNQLARLLDARGTPLHQSTISRIASGRTQHVEQPTALILADFFHVSVDQIRGAVKLPAAKANGGTPTAEALEVARAWQGLDPMNRAAFRDQIFYLAAVQKVARWMVVQKPRSPNYEAWEASMARAWLSEMKQMKLNLEDAGD